MKVYLMRHAEPLRPTEWDGADSTRPLSERGISTLSTQAEHFKDKGLLLKKIYSSPYERAKQTAEIVSQKIGLDMSIKDNLASGIKPAEIKKFLLSLKDEDDVLIVGHMPDMALFAGSVVPDANLLGSGLKPGEIWAVETGDMTQGWGTGTLLWQRTLDDWSN